jgi:hypothetical protein
LVVPGGELSKFFGRSRTVLGCVCADRISVGGLLRLLIYSTLKRC